MHATPYPVPSEKKAEGFMSFVLRRLVLVLVTAAIAFTWMPVHAGGFHTVHDQLVEQPAEQHFHDEHRPGVAHHHDADVDCSQVGHCSPVQALFPVTHVLPPEVSQRGRYAPGDVHAASLMPEASVPPPRRA